MKKIITGIKPSGKLTLGNCIGAINQMKYLQDNYDSYIFVADLHAYTVDQDPKEIKDRIKELIALYIASGLDVEKNTIYLQSENPYIPAISWLLECNTYYGEASRMIQFKEKSKENSNFTVALLTYPVLMAADILYADFELVPVGIDQKQHVEIARDIAVRFNNKFGKTFILPEPFINESGLKIKDLKNPEKKMSKSEENPAGTISMLDDLNVIRKKIMGSTTDSEMIVKYDPEKKPGISNLINIVVSLTEKKISDVEKMFVNKNYGEFKKYVADVVVDYVGNIQKKYNEILGTEIIDQALDKGIKKSISLAKDKYELMREKMGIIR